MAEGYKIGLESAKDIAKQLEEAGSEETIKILSHSMGAAYAEGLVKGLIEGGVPVKRIEKIVHLSPADPNDITIYEKGKDITRVQLHIDRDFTLFDKIRGKNKTIGGSKRMIKGVDYYGEINANGGTMLEYRKNYPNSLRTASYFESIYDYHTYTKHKSGTFDALRELESAKRVWDETVCNDDGICWNRYSVTTTTDKFNWNTLFLKKGEFMYNENKNGSGGKYSGPAVDTTKQ
jgi:hypothetical protein